MITLWCIGWKVVDREERMGEELWMKVKEESSVEKSLQVLVPESASEKEVELAQPFFPCLFTRVALQDRARKKKNRLQHMAELPFHPIRASLSQSLLSKLHMVLILYH